MLTAYRLLKDRCGLSHREAAAYHEVSEDTVKAWISGRNPAKASVIAELAELYQKIATAAAETLEMIQATPLDGEIELGYASDDHEASQLGWPCVGAQQAMLGLVIISAHGRAILLKPRGSTIASAAAAQAHGH